MSKIRKFEVGKKYVAIVYENGKDRREVVELISDKETPNRRTLTFKGKSKIYYGSVGTSRTQEDLICIISNADATVCKESIVKDCPVQATDELNLDDQEIRQYFSVPRTLDEFAGNYSLEHLDRAKRVNFGVKLKQLGLLKKRVTVNGKRTFFYYLPNERTTD